MIVGVDPGLGGALAWVDDDGALMRIEDMPVVGGEVSPLLLDALLVSGHVAGCILEWPGIMPQNGAKTARSIGMSLATVTAVMALRGIPIVRTSPGGWKRAMHLSSDKDASRALAIRTWPSWSATFARKKDADRAEAALIAEWWRTCR